MAEYRCLDCDAELDLGPDPPGEVSCPVCGGWVRDVSPYQ